MTKKTFLGAMAVVTAVALTGSALVASNMGFKLNYQLKAGDAGVTSKTGTNVLALPDNRQTGLTTSITLMNDIGFTSVANVQNFIKQIDGLDVYTGRKGSPKPDFALNAGAAVFVAMNPASTVNYIVVGSDDPALAYNLKAGDAGVTSKTGTNFYAYNYHQTATDAITLMNDIGFTAVANVQNFIKQTDGLDTYTGRKGSPKPNFVMVPGAGYFVAMNPASTVNYIPSHY